MAVAAVSPPDTKNSPSTTPLWMASLIGGVFVLAALGLVFYGVPKIWEATVAPGINASLGTLFNGTLRLIAQFIAATVLMILGSRLSGSNPVAGLRGGIFLAISTIFTVFFLARALAMIAQRVFDLSDTIALGLFLGALGGFGLLGFRFLAGRRFHRWANGIESAGWLSAFVHKGSQGRTVRRLTMVGFLIICGAGIQAFIHNQHLIGMTDWDVDLPFIKVEKTVTDAKSKANSPTTEQKTEVPARIVLLPDAQFTIPLLMIFLGLWISWRAVNYPPFADFLIATEAEMNKVSWTPRKALIRDTIVVLSTVFIIAMFIFVVDIFWGWLLSREIVGVLPRQSSYYHLELQKVPDDKEKQKKVIDILSSEAVGYKPEDAQAMITKVATATENSLPVRIKSQQQRDVKRSGFDEDNVNRLLRKLEEEGASVKAVPAKDEAKNEW